MLFLIQVVAAGCATLPFQRQERTSIITPAMRVAAIREIGLRAAEADDEEQRRLTEQLAMQIRTEPDPLVRLAIQESIAEFSTPVAEQVLLAGLQDEDLDVRIACCQRLGARGDNAVVPALRGVLEKQDDLDARLAAIDALGGIRTTESVAALAVAVQDRDPAMQYAAVQSLKAVSGQDLGNDVAAWREYATAERPVISVASKKKNLLPF